VSAAARVLAQAKINLLLRVLAQETSGYHSIETVFLRIDLADEVRVRITNGRSLDCAGPALPATGLGPTEKNLAYRAAVSYTEAAGWPDGFAIELDKRIPVGGGLGGGSADAGAVLRALDALSPKPLGSALLEVAGPLGADVPFMTMDAPLALGWSRGERLLPLHPLAPRPVVLLTPDFGISTAQAYGWVASDRGSYAPTPAVFDPARLATWEALPRIATNDFGVVVARRHPIIAELVDSLRAHGAAIAMLSGSGSTVFGIFDGVPDAAAVERSTGHSAVATRTSDRVVRVELDR